MKAGSSLSIGRAYKNIEEVMQSQQQLIDVLGRFTPKIVRMDG